MILRIKSSADVPYSEVTPEAVYRSRRDFMKAAAVGVAGAAAGLALPNGAAAAPQTGLAALTAKKSKFVVDESVDPLNTFDQITGYNNYYEFGTRKDDPARNAGRLTVKPWTVKVDGLVKKPGNYQRSRAESPNSTKRNCSAASIVSLA